MTTIMANANEREQKSPRKFYNIMRELMEHIWTREERY